MARAGRRDEAASARGRAERASILFAACSTEQRSEIAAATSTRLFGDGEAIVRQGAEGQSMFVVCSGRVSVVLEPDRAAGRDDRGGGYFGEMSLLTGEPRTATVLAVGDTTVLELDAESVPAARQRRIRERSSRSASPRWRGASSSTRRATAGKPVAIEAPATSSDAMKKFLGLA